MNQQASCLPEHEVRATAFGAVGRIEPVQWVGFKFDHQQSGGLAGIRACKHDLTHA